MANNSIKVILVDRLDKMHILTAQKNENLSMFLSRHYIPRDAVIAKVDGHVVDDNDYTICDNRQLKLHMVRAYQLDEYCKMLELWRDPEAEDKRIHEKSKSSSPIYSKRCLWFNPNGISELKHAEFDKETFVSWVDENFIQGIINKKIINSGDKVLLALSGGRDSLALLYMLQRNRDKLPDFELAGVTVADSAASPKDVEVAKEACSSLGLTDYTVLPLEYLNKTMGYKHGFHQAMDVALNNEGRGRSITTWHCAMRANVERFARERGIYKVAFGYQFEDLVTSVFRGLMQGELFGESAQQKSWGDFLIISPLWTVTKKNSQFILSALLLMRIQNKDHRQIMTEEITIAT